MSRTVQTVVDLAGCARPRLAVRVRARVALRAALCLATCAVLGFALAGCAPSADEGASCAVDDGATVAASENEASLPQPDASSAWEQGAFGEAGENGSASAEAGAFARLGLGEVGTVGASSFSLNEASWKVGSYWLPSEGSPCTSTEHDVDEGTALLLMRGLYRNATAEPIDVAGTVKVRAMVDGVGAYEGWAQIASADGALVGTVAAGETGDFVVGVPVPKASMDAFSSAEVRLAVLDADGSVQAGYCVPIDGPLA